MDVISLEEVRRGLGSLKRMEKAWISHGLAVDGQHGPGWPASREAIVGWSSRPRHWGGTLREGS